MNKLVMALAALGLASSATAANAETPTKETDVYFVVGVNDSGIGLVSDSIVEHGPGTKKDFWLLLIGVDQQSTPKGVWVLNEVDCDANTLQSIRFEDVATGQGVDSTSQPEAIKDGTPADVAADLICRGDDAGVLDRATGDQVKTLLRALGSK